MGLGDSTLTAALGAAQGLIRETVAGAVGEAANNLLNLMRSASTYRERGQLAFAQTHILQNRDNFLAGFATALRENVEEELSPKAQERSFRDPTDWQAVGLVGEDQIEERLSFERIGQFISHECEAELRELTTYTSTMLRHDWADPDRNPLRGNVIGSALHHAIEKISDDVDTQRILAKEIGQPLAKALPACYRAIINDIVARGVRQADLAVRPTVAPPAGTSSPFEEARKLWERSLLGRPPGDAGDTLRSWESSILGRHGRIDPLPPEPGLDSSAALLDRLMRGGLPGSSGRGALPRSPVSAQADAELMSLLRRLNGGDTVRDDLADAGDGSRFGAEGPGGSAGPRGLGRGGAGWGEGAAPTRSGYGELMAANLIRAHRDELYQASQGKLDHMVIEVVSSLFDQILSDTRVPPQMARQIARLQLPVLRVALRDTSFFSSRRHPVRRFINRVSSLATGLSDFDSGPGRELLARVAVLVKEIVQGDFDQIALYSEKLLELEKFTIEMAQAEVKASPAAETLKAKELEWRLQHRFSLTLHSALEPLALPAYLKDFLAQVWGQVILTAAQRDGAGATPEQKFRRAAFDLGLSIQAKRSLEQRTHFLATLPTLMGTLNEGIALVELPQAAREAFFGKLISDHAGSLKTAPGTELDHNMMLRQLEAAFRTPIPSSDELDAEPAAAAAAMPATLPIVVEQRFSAEEARSVGLIGEAAVDWSTPPVAAESDEPAPASGGSGATPAAAGADPNAFPTLDGHEEPEPEPIAQEPEEPTEGPQLRDHLQIGIAYQLQLKDQWEKVRLTYMSPGRTLFLFTHGSKDRGTISMTSRMLGRLCESRRLRAFERSFLVDRATERTRRQLAAVKPASRPASP